jgi:hypothetical protein
MEPFQTFGQMQNQPAKDKNSLKYFQTASATYQSTANMAKVLVPIVNSTLLVDRFVLSGIELQPKMEVRFQRSRSKTRPQSRKDGLGAKDLDGNPFLEPTQELRFVGNLTGGRFTVLLLPSAIQEIQRWQIFVHNSKTGLIDLFDVERSPDGLFNTRGSQVYTCVDHPEVFAQKSGKCVEPSLANPSQPCDQDLVPRLVTEGYSESALRPKTLDELDAEVAKALDQTEKTNLQSQGSFTTVSEPHIALGTGVKLGNVFTQEAWILPQASGIAPQALITSQGNPSNSSLAASRTDHRTSPSLWIEVGSRVRVGFGSGNQWNECATKSLLTPNSWNHLAVTFDGSAYRFYVKGRLREKIDQVQVYINGVLQKNADGTAKLEPIAGKQLPDTPITFLGSAKNSFSGTIDEIRLWSRVRSQAELQASLNQRLVGQETQLVGYWRFDEAAGNRIYDQTDHKINGTLQGTVQWSVSPQGSPPVTLNLDGWQWIASDAPVGESLGVSRSSFQIASKATSGALELRTVESGLTALLYYQQENAISGYAAEEKPLKRNARVMLAVATKNATGNRNEIATLDFAVSTSGKLAQIPDVVPLPIIHAPEAKEQSINEKLDKASQLQGQRDPLSERINQLNPLIKDLDSVVTKLQAAISDPTKIATTTFTDSELVYINNKWSKLKKAEKDFKDKEAALQQLVNEVNSTKAIFYEHKDFLGYSIESTPTTLEEAQLTKDGKPFISSLKVPQQLIAVVWRDPNREAGARGINPPSLAPSNSTTRDDRISEPTLMRWLNQAFEGAVSYVGDAWNEKIIRVEIFENGAYTKTARDEFQTAKTNYDNTKNDVKDEKDKLDALKKAYEQELSAKQTQLDQTETQLKALDSVLKNGANVPMHLVHTDPFGLTIAGGLLGFAWTKDTPLLFDSATGNLALYFRGTNDQFFVTYYETLTQRAKYRLVDQNNADSVICVARSTEPEMDHLKLAITSSDTADTCALTISGAGIEETWNQMPRPPEKFARVLNGQAGEREYVGSGTIKTELGQIKRLDIPQGIKRSLAVGDILFVGKTKVIVQEIVKSGATKFAISSNAISAPSEKLPLFFVEYDYAANAQTTKVPNDLYNGSLLVQATVQGTTNATSKLQIGQQVTSGSTLSCKWTAAAPGSTLTFDGVDDMAALASTTTLKQFEAPKDVTLEAWVRPSNPLSPRTRSKTVRIIHHYANDRSNYSLGLKVLSPALLLDGQDDYMRIPLNEPETEVTHEMWFKTSSPDCGLFAVEGWITWTRGLDRQIYLSGGNIKARIWSSFTAGNFNSEIISSTNLNLANDEWHHVAHVFGTIDGTPGQKLYVDGEEIDLYVNNQTNQKVARGTTGTSAFDFQNNAILIGYSDDNQNPDFKDPYFKGQIEEVRIWNRVRTLDEIRSSMNQRLTGSEPNLLGYWNFDEVTETTVKDHAPTNTPGTLYGAPQIAGSYWFVGVNNQYVQSQSFLPTNTWSHLAATFRQSYGLEFDGKGGYLDCGKDATLDISHDLTIEVFLQVTNLSGGNSILSRGRFSDGTNEQNVPYALFIGADGRIGFSFENTKHETKTYYSNGAINIQFCKIAITRKREQTQEPKKNTSGNVIGAKITAWDTITFYINGSASGTFKYESTQNTSDDVRQPIDVGSSNQPLEIGRGFNSTATFQGTISEVRIWNTAREQKNIAQEIKGNEKGLVSWWQFEENDGNTAFDSKSRNHATINGSVKWVKDPNPLGSKLLLYHNGAPVTSDPVSADPLKASEPQFTLAACKRNGSLTEYFQGELEDLRIWKTARTQEQIQDNLFRRLLGEQNDLIAYYTFDLDSERAKQALTTLYDLSSQGNDLTITGASYLLSTAPISDDAPMVRSALAGVRTNFHGLIQSQPGVQEYGDMQYDIDGNLIGVYKRCYSVIKNGQWQLLTSFKVGDLITEWIGQMQTTPQLIGYIEGAPPVPSENLTATGYIVGEITDYTGASSVELTQANSTNYTYSASKEEGADFSFETKLGFMVGTKANVGFGVAVESVDVENVIGAHINLESSWGWLNEASTGVGRTTTQSTQMGLRGYVENADAIAYPNMGRRFVPENIGMALVKSETADIFALRLKHNHALVSFQMRPNPDILPDRNIITFPLNPRYTKQGTLDGKIGVLDIDPDYPNARIYSPDSSYFKPIEAYALKDQINRQEVELQTYYQQYQASERGRRIAGVYGGDEDLASGEMQKKLPHLQKRNLVNSYVWTAAGGLYAETQESMDMYQEQSGGSYAFKGMAGIYTDLTLALFRIGAKLELDAMLGGHLNLTVTKSQESQTTFGLNVGLDKVESDVYLRNEKGEMVMDKSSTPDPTDRTGMSHWKPQRMPGRVDAYRFMSFYLEPKADHFDLFFNRVVDPIWLEQSDNPSAVALREAQKAKNNCWRIMHRVTYVSRVLPPMSNPAPSSLEKTLQTLDIDSNYELIRQLEPFVSNNLTSYPEFTKAIREAIKLYLPELQPHIQEIIQYMSLYFGLVDPQELAGQNAGEIEVARTINQPPIVNAGVDQTIGLDGSSTTATLDGIAVDDRIEKSEALFVTWQKISGEGNVELTNPNHLTTTATFTKRGKYVLRLTVDDGSLSASDEVTIVVNQPPVISAGADLQVKPRLVAGQPKPILEAQLTGLVIDSGLGDPDRGLVNLKWRKQSKLGNVTFSDSKSLETTATFDRSGSYLLRLTIDNGSFTANDEVLVSVADRATNGLQALYTFDTPTGTSVPDVSGAETPLNLTISDPAALIRNGGILTIKEPSILFTANSATRLSQAIKASNELTIEAWLKPSTLNHEGLARIITLSDGPGKRNFILGQSGSDYYVAIRTTATDANGSNQALTGGSVSTTAPIHLICTRMASGLVRLYLNGEEIRSRMVSGALSGWNDGFKLALGNELVTNPAPDRQTPGLGRQRAWLGSLHLVAIYSRALSLEEVQQNFKFGSDTNLPPVISAGSDQVINWSDSQPLPIRSELKGRTTHDREPQQGTLTWTQVAGPKTPNGVTLTNAQALITNAQFVQNGRYVMRLTVDDGELMASDEVTIAVNQPPSFTAQAEANLALVGGSIVTPLKGTLQNTGLADTGTLTTTWRRNSSSPASVAIAAPNQLVTEATFSDRGVYQLELVVNNGIFSKTAIVTIDVHQTPSVGAGNPQTVTLPILTELSPGASVQSQVTLRGEVRDKGLANPNQPEGLRYEWQQVSGPGQAVFANANQISTTATFTVGGLYVLRFTATNQTIPSLTSSADVLITVNQRPVVNAGTDQTLQFPAGIESEIELDGIVSDDGLPSDPGRVTVKWSKNREKSAPGTVTFTNATETYTQATFSAPGNYVLRLTATDGAVFPDGKKISVSDEVAIAVVRPPRITTHLVTLYTFKDNAGSTTITDVSGVQPALNLTFTGNNARLTGNALVVDSATTIASSGAATKVINSCKATNEITIEAWIKPSQVLQGNDPAARIVTLSANTSDRNFSVQQGVWVTKTENQNFYATRLRTTQFEKGDPPLVADRFTPTLDRVHLVYTRSADGITKLYINGVEQVYTRSADGITKLYINGVEQANNEVEQPNNGVTGDFSNWNGTYRLALANEFGGSDRAWLGEYYLVAIYNQTLTAEQVKQNYHAGLDSVV